jgi:hypothetical protein
MDPNWAVDKANWTPSRADSWPVNEFEQRRAAHLDRARQLGEGFLDGLAFSHETSALLRNWPTYRIPAQIRLTGPNVRGVRTSDVHINRAQVRDEDLDFVDGMPVLSGARTVVDLGRWNAFGEALITADAALRDGVTREQLQDVLRHQWNWPRIPRGMAVVRHADSLSESPAESFVRSRFITLALPLPALQVDIQTPERWIARSDFYWEEFRLAGEVDGRLKYVAGQTFEEVGDQLWREKLRQEDIEDAVHEVIRWTWAQGHAPDDVFAARFWRKVRRAQWLNQLTA